MARDKFKLTVVFLSYHAIQCFGGTARLMELSIFSKIIGLKS